MLLEDLDLLIEAKGTVTREAIRMAIGQLADYGRFRESAQRAILVPEKPRPDLVALVIGQAIQLIWEQGGAYASNMALPWDSTSG